MPRHQLIRKSVTGALLVFVSSIILLDICQYHRPFFYMRINVVDSLPLLVPPILNIALLPTRRLKE